MVDGVGLKGTIVKILLFGVSTAFSSKIGRFHEIFVFLTKIEAKNIDETLVIEIFKSSILTTKLKQNFFRKRNLQFALRFFQNSSMVQTPGADYEKPVIFGTFGALLGGKCTKNVRFFIICTRRLHHRAILETPRHKLQISLPRQVLF